jgi:hypothetical protein
LLIVMLCLRLWGVRHTANPTTSGVVLNHP